MGTRSLVNPKISFKMSATLKNVMTDGTLATITSPSFSYSKTLTSGCEADQANRGWQSEGRTLTSGATETLDLYDMAGVDIGAGAGLDALGQAVSPFEEIVAIVITNDNDVDEAGQLEIQPGASNGWTPIGIHTAALEGALHGGGVLIKVDPSGAGFNVTDGVSHTIKFTASGGDVVYSIYLFARHDDDVSSSSSSLSSSSSQSTSSSSSSSSTSSVSSNSSSSSISTSSASSISTSSASSISTSSESSSSSSISTSSASSTGV